MAYDVALRALTKHVVTFFNIDTLMMTLCARVLHHLMVRLCTALSRG